VATTTENIDEISFDDAVRAVALSDLQTTIEKAVGELLHRKVACKISGLELSLLNGASISLTIKPVYEGIPF
jgi:hypothetical protein